MCFKNKMVNEKKHVQINRWVRGLRCGEGREGYININLRISDENGEKTIVFPSPDAIGE
jgi:hypothetical protein